MHNTSSEITITKELPSQTIDVDKNWLEIAFTKELASQRIDIHNNWS
jgi:hypothetical protein